MNKNAEKILEYTDYIKEHITNIKRAYNEYGFVLCEFISSLSVEPVTERGILNLYNMVGNQIEEHDDSKFSFEEFNAYRQKFFKMDGEEEISDYDFNQAWLHHIHNNPHHPEYYIYTEPNIHGKLKQTIFNIPPNYLVEMILDWIAMGYKFDSKVYDYWKIDRSMKVLVMNPKMIELVDKIMDMLRKYDESKIQNN